LILQVHNRSLQNPLSDSDFAPSKKITTEQVKEIKRTKGEAAAAELNNLRIKLREDHQREGSEIAENIFLGINEFCQKEVISKAEIKQICDVISIHDQPSNGISGDDV